MTAGRRPKAPATAGAHPLDRFKAEASIDFITLGKFDSECFKNDAKTLNELQELFDGTVCLPGDMRHLSTFMLTLQDPSVADLQTLVDNMPESNITGLEFSVDFRQDEYDHDASLALYTWFRKSLVPERHLDMVRTTRRKQYCKATGAFVKTTMSTDSLDCTTVLWEARHGLQVRLYLKTTDNARRQPVANPAVRVEASMRTKNGSELMGVHRVGMLPAFVTRLRTALSPMLAIGAGFRSATRRRPERIVDVVRRQVAELKQTSEREILARRWARFGSRGVKHGLEVEPDARANRIMGRALSDLQEKLQRLQPPKKVPDYGGWMATQLGMYGLFPPEGPQSRRRTRSRPL